MASEGLGIHLRRLVVALLCIVAALAATPSSAQDAYALSVGDQLRVTVFGEQDLSGQFRVDGQGTIPMGLIGTVEAKGKTARELEMHIASLYADGYLVNPRITVEVLSFSPFFILGEVRNPGSFPYEAGMTVMSAIARAGGFTYRADEDDIEIVRGTDENREPQQVELDAMIQPGDMIRVTERLF